ncbi:MAG: cytochrome c oxidase subunit 3 [Deltaproteobacteria bacterium]|nr:MAG: cytochrome c oxidase subunit 3 [Deltaproteobacteria bacterium]
MGTAAESGFREATEVPTGRLGMWWFLASELVIFGGLIATYLLFRWRHPEWGAESVHTINAAGAFNTLVLLTSSLTMVLAHAAVERGDLARAVRNLSFTFLGGVIFLVVKVYEYTHEIQEGFTPLTNLFWSFYYGMTGLHALHVVGGMVAMMVVRSAVAKGRDPQRVEFVGLYWHFVDVVWIFLFPLLYLSS